MHNHVCLIIRGFVGHPEYNLCTHNHACTTTLEELPSTCCNARVVVWDNPMFIHTLQTSCSYKNGQLITHEWLALGFATIRDV
jgi:hypothetical protein